MLRSTVLGEGNGLGPLPFSHVLYFPVWYFMINAFRGKFRQCFTVRPMIA